MSFEFLDNRLSLEIPKRGSPIPSTCNYHPKKRVLDRTADRAFMGLFKTSNRVALMIDRIAAGVLARCQKSWILGRKVSGSDVVDVALVEGNVLVELIFEGGLGASVKLAGLVD